MPPLFTASNIKDDYRKSEALIAIALAQAKNGLRQEATSTFASAFAIASEKASEIQDHLETLRPTHPFGLQEYYKDKSEVLTALYSVQSAIALAQAQTKDFASALDTASKIKEVSFSEFNPFRDLLHDYIYKCNSYKYKALSSIASAQAQTKDFASALETVSKIKDDSYKYKTLSSIASIQAETKDFVSSLETASKITSYLDKYTAFIAIMSAKDKANLTKDAIITIESMNISKSEDWYFLSSNLEYATKELWIYLMNQCFEYHNIAFLVCSLICKRYKRKVNEIRHLILNFE